MQFDLKFYFKVFLSRFRLFFVVFTLVLVAGLFAAASLPKSYRAEAYLLVESSQIPADLAASTVRTELSDQVQVIQQKLMTRDNLLELAYRFNIFADEPELQPGEIAARMRDMVWTRLSTSRHQAKVFSITAEAKNGRTAADIVNALVDQVLELDAAFRTEVATDTLAFFEKEVKRLSQALDASNRRILEFQNGNIESLPDTLEYRLSRQALLQERLTQARREISQLSDQRRKLVQLFETTGRTESRPQSALSDEEIELAELRSELRGALAIFSESNPKVTVLRSQIARLEGLIAGRLPTEEREDPGTTVFKAQLVEIDSQIESLTETAEELEASIAELQKTIERTPTNSISLSAMQRDRDNTQKQYDMAVNRLSAAATGERIEVLSKGQRLSVIERAVVPSKPAKPKMLLIAVGVVGMAFLLGVGAVILKELLNPKIRRPVELTRKLGITPLGTLPFVETPGEVWRHRGMRGVSVAIVLACIIGALLLIDREVMPLEQLAQKVLREGRL